MLKPKLWIFFSLIAVGAMLGTGYLLLFAAEKNPRAELSETGKPENASATTKTDRRSTDSNLASARLSAVKSDLADAADFAAEDEAIFYANRLRDEGDAFLQAGNFTAAATRFKKLQRFNGRFSSDISIRLGICDEFEQHPGSAAAHYHRALELNSPPNHRLMALSGLSRTWIERGNRSEALHILCDLFLESVGEPALPEEIQAQINFQLGTTLQDITLQHYHYDLSQPDGVAFQTTLPRLAVLVDLLNELPELKPDLSLDRETLESTAADPNNSNRLPTTVPRDDGAPVVTILQNPTESVELTIVNVRSKLQPLSVIVKHLAASSELELFASPNAQTIITGRSKSLNVNGVQLSLLLDNLLLPLNLFWYQDETGLHLVSLEEKDIHADAYWSAAMERTYRRFNVAFPDDYRTPSVLLSRGNLNLIEGDLDRASNQYQELSNLGPRDELLARLFFNVGKVEMRLGRNENAIRHFYHAVDQSYDTAFQSSAYWLVGQLSLETNQLEQAIKTAGRSLSTARIDQQKRLAALTMARAYLLSNQPFSANQVLFENHRAFKGSDLEHSAAVLGSYARFVGVTDESSLHTESNRLLAAIAMAPEDSYQHFLDIYIAARAYLELGFQEKAIEKLTLAADSTTISAWRRQFLFELGVQLSIADQKLEAIAVFEFLIEGETDQWLQKSLLQLGPLYIETNRFRESIEICERLWNHELNEDEKIAILNTMGQAYRRLGEHHSAALCFAGMLPQIQSDNH